MAKTKFFRVMTEGDTTDGRVIQRQWIEEMAATYNPALYGARIWMEHLRGIYPDSTFRAYGDVLALKAEKVEGGKLALFAQLDPTPDLIALNKARQKIYSSAEVDDDFAKTGKAYLVGLAVTDTPASLGTEMLQFAANATTNPLASRKQSPNNLFTAAQPITIELEDTPTMSTADQTSLLDQIKALFSAKPTDPPPAPADPAASTSAAVLEIGNQVKAALEGFSSQLATGNKAASDQIASLTTKLEESSKAFGDLKTAHDKLQSDFTALAAKLDATPGNDKGRPAATGGNPENKPGDKPDCL